MSLPVETPRKSGNKSNKKYKIGQVGGEVIKNINEDSIAIKHFREYAAELDSKHDRYERIVKLSRDITIESKRIIFLLHNSSTDVPGKKEQTLKEAEIRLKTLGMKHFKTIVADLETYDPYPFHRAYSAGLQEFVEAVLFYYYIKFGKLQSFSDIQKLYFNYEEEFVHADGNSGSNVKFLFPFMDYILGLADFTGELMRKSLNNLSIGQHTECFRTCELVRNIQTGFMSVSNTGYRIIGRKFITLSHSVAKMEHVCYTLRVRGNEIPNRVLMGVFDSKNNEGEEELDEGIF